MEPSGKMIAAETPGIPYRARRRGSQASSVRRIDGVPLGIPSHGRGVASGRGVARGGRGSPGRPVVPGPALSVDVGEESGAVDIPALLDGPGRELVVIDVPGTTEALPLGATATVDRPGTARSGDRPIQPARATTLKPTRRSGRWTADLTRE